MSARYFSTLLLFLISASVHGQNTINGIVGGDYPDGGKGPLVGANVYWLGTDIQTVTNENGIFEIERADSQYLLVTSFVGYVNDTIDTRGLDFVHNHKQAIKVLDEVKVEHRAKGMEVNTLDPLNTKLISQREFQKAACCNLSESFETNPSIDVSFSDAVSGTRQIQMLGLSGPNILVTRELIPDLRGIAAVHGLSYVPGTWIESIQLSKGSGSVAHGFESVVGQMNVELKKPDLGEKALLNIYGNMGSALEFNGNVRSEINPNLSTASMIQLRNLSVENDNNGDGFRDMPLSNRAITLHRWKFNFGEGFFGQIGVRGVFIDNEGGQMSDGESNSTFGLWRYEHTSRRGDIWAKSGRVWRNKPWKSMGLQLNANIQNLESGYGIREYDARQESVYANWIFQSIFDNTSHSWKAGASFQGDWVKETADSLEFKREELVPGGFFEYSFLPSDNFTLVAGIRGDYHNNYGFNATPRLHLRYRLFDQTTVKFSAGRSWRTANIFAENQQIFASNRQIGVLTLNTENPYGLDAEEAWNFGFNITKQFVLDYREGVFSLDFYRTDFQNQIVVDYDRDPSLILFYNLSGQSFANSFQAQLDYELVNRLDLRLAYRWFDVQSQYLTGLLDKPLISRHRAFINLEYSTINYWSFDWTLNWNGSKRIPGTQSNPENFRLDSRSPDFFVMNAQITKKWNQYLETYIGGENLLNFRQEDPIISANDPFGTYFDASLVWGPIFGRMAYVGARMKFN